MPRFQFFNLYGPVPFVVLAKDDVLALKMAPPRWVRLNSKSLSRVLRVTTTVDGPVDLIEAMRSNWPLRSGVTGDAGSINRRKLQTTSFAVIREPSWNRALVRVKV